MIRKTDRMVHSRRTPSGGSRAEGGGAVKPEGRAIAVAELLRQGYTGQQVSEMLKVTDRGGTLEEALVALRDPKGTEPKERER